MKTIGFIGVYDKTDFIIYVAKALTVIGKKVLVIDNTLMRKSKVYCTSYKSYESICDRIRRVRCFRWV